MITVYVWPPKGQNVGHAAAMVGNTYISWWPQTAIEVDPKGKRVQLQAHPIRRRSYASDVADEGEPPLHRITLNGLDEKAILQWWAGFGLVSGVQDLQGPLPPYHLLKQSCSTVVAKALRTGGGDKHSGLWHANNVVWTPMDVQRYAASIATGLSKKKK